MFNKKHFLDAATTFVVQAQYARTLMHPADIAGAREIAHVVAQVSAACSAVRAEMPVLIDNRFDWELLNTDVLVHIFKFSGSPKRMAALCRRFHCIYFEKFVERIFIPYTGHNFCYSPYLPSFGNIGVMFNTKGASRPPPVEHANIHEFLLARRYTKIPKDVAQGCAFSPATIQRLLVPHITLDPVIALPINTSYLAVVEVVYGVKDLTLELHSAEVGYYFFPRFVGLEILRIMCTREHRLFGDGFYTFYRNILDLYNQNKPTKMGFSAILYDKFKAESDKYPLPLPM